MTLSIATTGYWKSKQTNSMHSIQEVMDSLRKPKPTLDNFMAEISPNLTANTDAPQRVTWGREGEKLANTFYEGNIILIGKPHKNITKKNWFNNHLEEHICQSLHVTIEINFNNTLNWSYNIVILV